MAFTRNASSNMCNMALFTKPASRVSSNVAQTASVGGSVKGCVHDVRSEVHSLRAISTDFRNRVIIEMSVMGKAGQSGTKLEPQRRVMRLLMLMHG
jgi:hypothetical protein